jgi:DDE domain
MRREGELWRFVRHRRGRWLHNRVEQDHRRIQRRTRPMLGFGSFQTARRALAGVEAMAMLGKGQVRAAPGESQAGPAGLCPAGLRPCRLIGTEGAGPRLLPANATEPRPPQSRFSFPAPAG